MPEFLGIDVQSIIVTICLPWMIYLYIVGMHHFFINLNTSRNMLDDDEGDEDEDEDDDEVNDDQKTEQSKIKYYEEKYLDEFRAMKDSPVSLTEEELLSLKNSIVVEYTPVGNVAMFYDSKRETFGYYSDTTIPYRFLEVVGRKYVLANCCKNLFVDMNEELKQYAEKKLNQEKEKEEDKEEKENKPEEQDTSSATVKAPTKETTNTKKNVFAKFKSYNNNNTKSSVSVPAKEMQKIVPENETTESKNDFILKDRANRYTCEGRFSNFAVLQKVDKKITNKRLNMTYADFKKNQTIKITA